MNKNDILRTLRYALNINDSTMIGIFKLTDHEIEQSTLTDLLKKEDEEGFVLCRDDVLGYFLDGLILQKRGRKEVKPGETRESDSRLTNNTILKKLRIALELKEDDMLAILKLGDVYLSKSELTALFRKEGNKNYKECGDQFLRKFLKGLSLRYRT
ncbi:MAG: DUF1456 family protein [Thermodesulfovibrionales bacterium]|nr:DUF1456 family protein [Thermodesulfovibrionales bacterium]